MSKSKKKTENREKNIIIKSSDEEKNKENQDEFEQDTSKDIFAEDFDFFQEESKRDNNIFIIEETIEEIKKEKNKDNDLDEYIKDCIEYLEEYSSIFSFEDLIYDPEYTLKSFMKSLKKIINFHYFYTKFTLPKNKNVNKNKEKIETEENQSSNKVQNSKGDKITDSEKEKNKKTQTTKIKDNNEDKKSEENILKKNNESMEQKFGDKIKEESKEKDKENKKGKAEDKKGKKQKIQLEKNKQNEVNSMDNVRDNNQKDERKKYKNNLENRKKDFFLKLSLKEKYNNNNNNLKKKQIEEIFPKENSKEISQINISSSENSKVKTNSKINDKSDTITDETLSRVEEYKLMNYDNILSIINNNANSEESDLIDGKNFESKVRKYFQVVLDICSDKSLTVYKNSGTSIQGLYKYYEALLEKKKIEKNDNISGNSKIKGENNKTEFDLLVDNVGANVIKKIMTVFKNNIIAKNWKENMNDDIQYQIVGEIAKNILNQSIDKHKQVKKIIDVLLIEEYLNRKNIIDIQNSFMDEIIKEYYELKLNINKNKFIFLFTDGSFIELKKSLLFDEKEIINSNGDLLSLDIKNIFPLKNKNRYCKNIIYIKKIIESLNKSNLPYIMFYVGEELNNGIERILINYIKDRKDNNKYKTIISKIENNEKLIAKNISQSFFIKTINKKLNILNKNDIFNIIKNIINIPQHLYWNYFEFLYQNLIDKKKVKDKYYILLFIKAGLIIPSLYENNIKEFNEKSYLTQIEIIYTEEKDLFINLSKYKNKKIIKALFIVETNEDDNFKKNFENKELEGVDSDIIELENLNEINFDIINSTQIKEIIKRYILSHFCHFSEENYIKLNIFHKKLIYDINNLGKELPIKSKEVFEEKIFIDKSKNLFNSYISDEIIKKKSEEILLLIKKCIGAKLYDYLLKSRLEYINHYLNKNLLRISEHLFCYYIYDKFFKLYLPPKIT